MNMSIFNLALDVLLVVAISGLWVVWFMQAGQRKKVEEMLLQASKELQEATALLDHVMTSLAEQKAAEMQPRQRPASEVKPKERPRRSESYASPVNVPNRNSQLKREGASNYAAQVMRLNREGLTAEKISEKLGVPIAQVRLMLLLQAPKV